MTITKYSLIVAVIALVLTMLFRKQVRHPVISYIQNFLGVFFIFSGLVKAIDPLGTAYKMEEYFETFVYTFSEGSLKFLAPLFPRMAEHAVAFSVGMIVLEMVLGLMLIIGAWRQLTVWVFLLLMLFFTALTGFTYLSGYVPEGVNFFDFRHWGPFVDTQMKVTDCGCFGDFMKLKPKTTFTKDVIMLLPALILLFSWRRMHQLLTPGGRRATVIVSLTGFLLFGLSNFVWDLPVVDFRPFKVGVNIREQKQKEADAEAAVEILSYTLTNKKTGKVIEVPYKQYLKEYKKYPKEDWDFKQNKTEPAIPHTKISDFEIQDLDGNDVTDTILNRPGYSFMFVSKGLEKIEEEAYVQVPDTVYVLDTVSLPNDSVILVKTIDTIVTKEVEETVYTFPEDFLMRFRETIVPLANAAQQDGIPSFLVIGMEDPDVARDFARQIGAHFPIYMADNILLKTIIRSNPGTVLLHDATILGKWHYKKLPPYETIRRKLIKKE